MRILVCGVFLGTKITRRVSADGGAKFRGGRAFPFHFPKTSSNLVNITWRSKSPVTNKDVESGVTNSRRKLSKSGTVSAFRVFTVFSRAKTELGPNTALRVALAARPSGESGLRRTLSMAREM